MPRNIDFNRGVTIRKYTPTNMYVYMYKDTPGVFLDPHGKPVHHKMAQAAGFDVTTLLKEKHKREKMRDAMSQIEAELELADTSVGEIVLEERGGYKLVDRGYGRADVMDGENRLTPVPVPVQEAQIMLGHLAPDDKEVKEEAKKNRPQIDESESIFKRKRASKEAENGGAQA